MSFKVLTDEEFSLLSDKQKIAYNEEYELYKERCAFVDKIEKLDKVKLPEVKASYKFLTKINTSTVKENYNVEKSNVVLEDIFTPEMIAGKDSIENIDKINQRLGHNYLINDNGKITIPKTKDGQYDIPEIVGVELPKLNTENIQNDTNYVFDSVEVGGLPSVLINTQLWVNDIEYENIKVENLVNIDTAHPNVKFDKDEIKEVDVNLEIDSYCEIPETLEYEGVEFTINKTNAVVTTCETINAKTIDKTEVNNDTVFVAEAKGIEFKQTENELCEPAKVICQAPNYYYEKVDGYSIENVDKKVCEAPLVTVNEINENTIQIEETKIIETPKISKVSLDNNIVDLNKTLIAEAKVDNEIIFDDTNIKKETIINANVPTIKFISPKLKVDNNKILIGNPMNVENNTKNVLELIIGSMGDNHEE